MRRTIEMKGEYAYYRGKRLDYLLSTVIQHFNFEDSGKHVVTIVEGTKYRIILDPDQMVSNSDDIELYAFLPVGGTGYERLYICREYFDKIFFKPDSNKTYDITVKKVKK
jgi:formylmethanofuran dehydrogenase subunit E